MIMVWSSPILLGEFCQLAPNSFLLWFCLHGAPRIQRGFQLEAFGRPQLLELCRETGHPKANEGCKMDPGEAQKMAWAPSGRRQRQNRTPPKDIPSNHRSGFRAPQTVSIFPQKWASSPLFLGFLLGQPRCTSPSHPFRALGALRRETRNRGRALGGLVGLRGRQSQGPRPHRLPGAGPRCLSPRSGRLGAARLGSVLFFPPGVGRACGGRGSAGRARFSFAFCLAFTLVATLVITVTTEVTSSNLTRCNGLKESVSDRVYSSKSGLCFALCFCVA